MSTLYIMRHGEAEAPGVEPDAMRALTLRGVRSLQEGSKGLLRLGLRFDLIACSPLVRTKQTADIVRAEMGAPREVEPIDVLRPGARPAKVLEELSDQFGELTGGHILLIGHMPDVSYLAGYTTAGCEVGTVNFNPGTVAAIDFAARPRAEAGALRWVLTLELLVRLGFGD